MSDQHTHWTVIRERLNKRQAQLGLSNYYIAKEIGISQSSVGRIKDGTNVPSVEIYLRLLAVLQLKSIIKSI